MHKILIYLLLLSAARVLAQEPISNDKPRVFITDSQSWEIKGASGGGGGFSGSHTGGGARPQTAEIIKTFGEKCPAVIINNIQEKANYIVVLDHEGGKSWWRTKNKVAVFNAQSGDSVISKSTLSLGGSVDEACKGITKHWSEHKPVATSPTSDSSAKMETTAVAASVLDSPGIRLSVESIPAGADIEIDGSFMGSTPSSLHLQAGEHKIVIKKNGYKTWEKKMKIAGGDISIKAELEKP